MDYISYMRSMIGNKPMFLVGAGTLTMNKANGVLMIKRTDNKKWEMPTGMKAAISDFLVSIIFPKTFIRPIELFFKDILTAKEFWHDNRIYKKR